MLARVGARRWISFIMIAWGLASTATIFATSAATLYWLRMLTAQGGAPLVQLRGVCLASAESYTAMSIFWTTPDQACTPQARAVGIAVIPAIGNIWLIRLVGRSVAARLHGGSQRTRFARLVRAPPC